MPNITQLILFEKNWWCRDLVRSGIRKWCSKTASVGPLDDGFASSVRFITKGEHVNMVQKDLYEIRE